jgi:cyclophilin family peptidyl-prolyl cis-trans isomerase
MVVKSSSPQADRFALPLVNEYIDTQESKPLVMHPAIPVHDSSVRYEEADQMTQGTFWRPWGNKAAQNDPSLPSWVSNPQSAEIAAMSIPALNANSKLVLTAKRRQADVWSLFMFASVVVGLMTYWHLTVSLEAILGETEAMLSVRNSINIKLRSAEKDVRMLSREVQATESIFKRRKEEKTQAFELEEAKALEERDAALAELHALEEAAAISSETSASLRAAVQRAGALAVANKWGPRNHVVEFELEFPGQGDGPTKFSVEMASIQLMPHSVHTFMEMVDKHLWDGCSFVMNAMHVIKAAPLAFEASNSAGAEKARAFTDAGLNGPRFNENNDHYPHMKYTLGFAGGNSPSWYINTEDNTEIHGGDPAFARIISGFDTIARLEDSETSNGIWFKQRIGIKSARIVA